MQRDFKALGAHEYDLAIIGGGASGAAIALDASLRGLSVALIDKGDFCAATSAGSTKLMHGGLRYLANGDIANVREGLRERRHWSRMAKHLVHPLPFIIPLYEQNNPSRRMLKLGLYLYDWLAFDRNRAVDPMQKMPSHRAVNAAQVLGLSPLTPRVGPQGNLTGGLMYHDGQMLSPERLVLAILRTAVQAGAVVVNHAEATDFLRDEGRITGVRVADKLSSQKTDLRAALCVNAAGPWADILMAQSQGTNRPAAKKLIRSKGIHLVTKDLTRGVALAIPVDDGHLFITPYMGLSLLATTDTKFNAHPDEAAVTQDDIKMLLDKTNKAMPDADVTQADIIHAYVGLRPLVADMDDQADATYGLSRGSEIYDHARHGGPQGLVSALGGKWTTSRRLGEQIVDLAFAKLGRPLANKRSADTLLACAPREDLGLFMDRMRAAYPALETETIDVLSRLYGSLLPEMMVADTSGLEALGDEVLAARIAFALNDEMAAHLTDVVMRRLVEGQLGLIDKKQSDVIAAYMAERLGWDASALKKQKAALARAWALPNSRAKAPAQPRNKTPGKTTGKTPGKTKGKTAAPRRAKSKKA